MSIKEPNRRLTRWSFFLLTYGFNIIYRKGSNHSIADYISKPVLTCKALCGKEKNDCNEGTRKILDVYADKPLLNYLIYRKSSFTLYL